MQGHKSHSLSDEPGTGIISRLETCRGTEATHSLVSQGQESSAGLKHAGGTEATHLLVSQGQESSAGLNHAGAQKPLTYW
jgi:hypothetical protein